MRVRTSLHAKRALALAGRVVACSMLVGIGLTLAGSSAWGSPSAPPEMTTTTVTCSPNPAAVGEPVTCVANVSVANVSAQGGEPPVSIESAMSYVPTGSVSFSGFGGVSMGSVTLVGGAGSVTVTTQATGGPLPVGSDVVTADYTPAPGTVFEASSGNTTEVVVSLGLSPFSQTVTLGAPVTVTAQVTPTGTTSSALTGSAVGFFSSSSDQLNSQGFLSGGSQMTCSQTLPNQVTGFVSLSSSAQAQCTTTFATPGTYYLQATYGGVYPSFLGSNSNVVSITVQSPPAPPIPTSTTVSCSPNPATAGDQATCVATVSSQGGATPTGSVSFSGFRGVSMGSGSVTLVSGAGSVTVTTQATGGPLPVGSDVVTADYTPASGTVFEASSGNTTEGVVSLGLSPSSQTVTLGAPVTVTAQVTPTGATVSDVSAVGFFSSSSDQHNGQGVLSGASHMTCSQNQVTGYVSLSSSGQAQCTTTFGEPGTYWVQATASVTGSSSTVSATFAVNGPNGNELNSNVVSITVQSPPGPPTPTPPPPPSPIPTSTTVSCSPNPATTGEQATCVAKVSTQGGATPTGSVSFSGFGGVSMGSVTLVGGHGSMTVTTQATSGPLPVGSDVVTADYTPASGTVFEASSGNTTEVVNPVTSPVTSPTSPPTATAPPRTTSPTSTSTTPTTTIPPTTTTVSEGPKPVRLVTGPGAAPASSDPLEWSGVALVGLGLAGLAWSLFELLRGRRGRHV